MKNKLLTFLLSSFLSATVLAQTGRIGEHSAITGWTVPTNSFANAAQGRQLVERIIDAVGLKSNFEIQPANIENAAAIVYGGRRYVLYNPTFINNLVKTTGTEWAAISVLAHEIGHHLNGHTVTPGGSQPAQELEADEFSGYVLRKMGATLAQSQAAMKTLATANATYTHPAQYDRLASIEKGWNHADDQLAGRPTKKSPDVQPQPQAIPVRDVVRNNTAATTAALDTRAILGDVYFNAAPSTTFYVTANYNLVKIGNNGVSVLGKLARLNSSEFPYVLYDAQNTQLFISRGGAILTQGGRQIGYLRNHSGQ
jgi:predicted HD phosphohydrolase